MTHPYKRRDTISWAFYDWANSAFFTTVLAGFFPVFFQKFWSVGVDPTVSTSRLGFANGIAMLHNAGRAGTPLVNVVGANASYHQPNYPEHELINGRVTDLTRAVSHWSEEARSASELGELGARAAALAKTGKVCTIVAPTNRHWEDANPPPAMPAAVGFPRVAEAAVAAAAAETTRFTRRS